MENESGIETQTVVSFAVLTEQASKLQLGKNKSMTCFYKDRVIVHLNHAPFIVSILGNVHLNVGLVNALSQELFAALSGLRSALDKHEV
jgi:hypothetical protein